MFLLLIVSAKRGEQNAAHDPADRVTSTVTVIPEFVDELAQFVHALINP